MAIKGLALIEERDRRNKKKKEKETVQLKSPEKKETTTVKKTVNNKGTTYTNKSTISTKPTVQNTTQNRTVTNKDRLSSNSTFGGINTDIRTVKTQNKPKQVYTADIYERDGNYYYKDGKKEKQIDRAFVEDALKNKKSGVIGRYDSKGTLRTTDEKGNVKKQSLGKKAGYLGRTAGVHAEKGTVAIADAAMQEAQNDLKKGENLKTTGQKIAQLAKAISNANPQIGMRSAIQEAIKNSGKIWKDKDKNTLQKYVGTILEGSEAVGTGQLKGVKDMATLAGSLDNSLDEKVAKAQEKLDAPVNKQLEKLEQEKYNYGKGMRTAAEIVGTTANMAPGIATSVITRNPELGLLPMMASAKGQTTERALQQGADLDTAVKMGTTSGLIEGATEQVSGGLNVFGKGSIDDIIEGKINSSIRNKGINFLAKQGFGLTGEVGEELISDLAGVLIDKGTIDPNAKYTWEDFINTVKNTIGSTALTNLLTGGYGGGAYRQNIADMQDFQTKQAQRAEVIEQVNNGTIDKSDANQKFEQIENGTYEQNKNLDQIATQQRDAIVQAVQTGQLSQAEATQEMEALNNTLTSERERINTPQTIEKPKQNEQQEQPTQNKQKANINVKQNKQKLMEDFKKLTGDDIMLAEAKLGGYQVRQLQRENGNLEDTEEPPYNEEAMKLYNTIQNSKKTSSHLYHSTPANRIQSIIENGLKIGSKQNQEGVSSKNKLYLSATEELARNFTPNEEVTLRVKPNAKLENLDNDLLGGEGSYTITNDIEPKYLQVKENGKWVDLLKSKYVEQQTNKQNDNNSEIKQVENKSDLKEVIDEDLYNVDMKDVENQIYRENYKLNEDVDDEEGPVGNYWDLDDTYFKLKDGNTLWITTPTEYGKLKNGKTNYNDEIHNKINIFIEDANQNIVEEKTLKNDKGEFTREDIINEIKSLTYDDSNKQAEGQIDMFGNVHVGKKSNDANKVETKPKNEEKTISNKDNEGRILSEEDQERLKDSKLRDEKGNIISFYHGAKENIDEFNSTRKPFYGDNNVNFFTNSKDISKTYGDNINNVYIDSKNPYILDGDTDGYSLEYSTTAKKELEENSDIIREIRKKLDENGSIYFKKSVAKNNANILENKKNILTNEEVEYLTNHPFSLAYLSVRAKDGFGPYPKSVMTNDIINAVLSINDKIENKYDSVLFKSIRDSGQKYDENTFKEKSDVVATFNSEQIIKIYENQQNIAKQSVQENSTNEQIETNQNENIPATKSENVISEEVKPQTQETTNEIVNQNTETQQETTETTQQEERKQPEILDKMPTEKKSTIKSLKKGIDTFRKEITDRFAAVYDMAQKTKNKTLYHKADRILASDGMAQVDIDTNQVNLNGKPYKNFTDENGNKVSMSLEQAYDIYNKIPNKDKNTFLVNQLNIDRLNQGVDQFEIPMEDSERTIAQLREKYPDIDKWSDNIYQYYRNLQDKLVESGRVSQELADKWRTETPHYVHIQRDVQNKGNTGVSVKNGKIDSDNLIRKVKGGTYAILPIKDTTAKFTQNATRAITYNDFGKEYARTIGYDSQGNNATEVDMDEMFGLDPEFVNKDGSGNYTMKLYENGGIIEVPISEDVYKALSPQNIPRVGVLAEATTLYKDLLTNKNPFFGFLRNPIKDVQDMFLYSKHPLAKSMATYTKLFAGRTALRNRTITRDGVTAQDIVDFYHNTGNAVHSIYKNGQFDSKNRVKESVDKVLSPIEKGNDFMESMPRITEFWNTIQKEGYTLKDGELISQKDARIEQAKEDLNNNKISQKEYNKIIEKVQKTKEPTKTVEQVIAEASYNAADVTVNFKRGGRTSKAISQNGGIFFNPSVQGASKFVRNITEAVSDAKSGDFRAAKLLVARAAMLGVAPAVLSQIMYGDDDEYKDIQDYQKDQYYIIKGENGNWIRIPKGRAISLFQSATRRGIEKSQGREDAFKGYGQLIGNQIAPNNPLDNNIFSPITSAVTNKSWSGNKIVSDSMAKRPVEEQFNEKTDEFSKWIGKKLHISPMKVNYVIDQYSGVLGDLALPQITPKATTGSSNPVMNILRDNYSFDAANSNKNVGNFYDTKREWNTKNNSTKATEEDKLKSQYMNTQAKEMYGLYTEKQKIQMDKSLSKKEKYEQSLEVQKKINEFAKKATENVKKTDIKDNTATVGNTLYYKDTKGEWHTESEKTKEKREDLGLTPEKYYYYRNEESYTTPDGYSKYITSGKNAKMNMAIVDAFNFDTSDYLEYTYKINQIKTGNTAKNKKEVAKYINSLPLSKTQKAYLYRTRFKSYRAQNNEITNQINKSNLSKKEKEEMYSYLGLGR